MKKKLTLDEIKVKSFKTSINESKIIAGGDTVTNCLCSETFWIPCDCGGDPDGSEPEWVCGPDQQHT